MSYKHNAELASTGYAPVARCAEYLDKPRSTFHRLVKAGKISGCIDKGQTYINVWSLVEYYTRRGQQDIVAKCDTLATLVCGVSVGVK